MNKTHFLIIEDGLSMLGLRKHFTSYFPGRSIFCKTYGQATEAIQNLQLQKNENLFVILDHDLGVNTENKNGVDLFIQLRQKFPDAFIVNYSSDPENFSKNIKLHYFDSAKMFDAVISNKNVAACVASAKSYAETITEKTIEEVEIRESTQALETHLEQEKNKNAIIVPSTVFACSSSFWQCPSPRIEDNKVKLVI